MIWIWFLFSSQAKMPFDANKLYCSEILAILLQNNDSKCVSLNGFMVSIKPFSVNLSLTFQPPLSSHTQTENMPSPFPSVSSLGLFMLSFSLTYFLFPSFPFSLSVSTPGTVSCTVSLTHAHFSLSFSSITLWFHVGLSCFHLSPFNLSFPLSPTPLSVFPSHFCSSFLLVYLLSSLLSPSLTETCKASDSHRTIRSLDRFSLVVRAILIFSGSRVLFYTHHPLFHQCWLN